MTPTRFFADGCLADPDPRETIGPKGPGADRGRAVAPRSLRDRRHVRRCDVCSLISSVGRALVSRDLIGAR